MKRQERLKALAALHARWVSEHLDRAGGVFAADGRKPESDYNQHHVDIDADGAAEDEFAEQAAALFGGAVLNAARRVLSGKYDPHQRRDDQGQWTDGTPDLDLDVDSDDDADDHDNASLSASYLDKYGKVTDEETVEKAGTGTELMAVAVTDKRSLHVAQGRGNRKVLIEVTPDQARSLSETLADLAEGSTDGIAVDAATGVTVTRAGDRYEVAWPDGTTSDLDDSDQAWEAAGLAEALRSMAGAHEDRFGLGAKSLVGRVEKTKLAPKVDKLRLNPRIDLGDGEELRASRKLPSSVYAETQILGAAVSTPAGPEVRVGVALLGDEQKWSADQDGATLKLNSAGIDRITAAMEAENKAGKTRSVWLTKQWDELERLDDNRSNLDGAGLKRLEELLAWNESFGIDDMFSEGVVAAGEWGDLAYQVSGSDDGEGGWTFYLAVKPVGAGDGWVFPELWSDDDGPGRVGEMSGPEMRKFLKQLGDLRSLASEPGVSNSAVRGGPARRDVRRVVDRAYTRDSHGRFAETPGGGILDADAYHDLYGNTHDDTAAGDDGLTVRIFEGDDAHIVWDHEQDMYEVALELGSPDRMRELAETLDMAAAHEPDEDAEADEDGFTVAWEVDDLWVGLDHVGDVKVSHSDDAAVSLLDLGVDDVPLLVDALRAMADSWEDLNADDTVPTAVVGRAPVTARARVRGRSCPLVYARTYTRDRLGRFARVPGINADEYHSSYGTAVAEYEVGDTDLTVRAFEGGTAHIVAEYTAEDGSPMFDVLFDWHTSQDMRTTAAALEWGSQYVLPDGDDEFGIVATRNIGDGWLVGVDDDGLVSLIEDRRPGAEFESGVTRARMDADAAYDLASGIYEMAEQVDDIDAAGEDDGYEFDDEAPDDAGPSASGRAKTTRAARVRGKRPVRTTMPRPRQAIARANTDRPTRPARGREPWFRIENTGGSTADVYIYSEIGCWGLTADAFVRELAALKVTAIDLHINSPGGDVFEGVAIYNALKQHKAKIHVFVDGYAASIASVIAMAGDTITMGRGTQMMIHEGNGGAVGDARDLRAYADLLDRCSDTIAGFYAGRAGGDPKAWRERMLAETWYSASEAVAAGLADQVSADAAENRGPANVWDLSIFNYAGRNRAPAPELDRPVRAAAPRREPRRLPVAPEPAAPMDFTGLAEIFPAAVQAAATLPFDPDHFRSLMQAVAADAPAPPAPITVTPDPDPVPEEPPPVEETEPELFDPNYFRTVMRNVAESAPAPPEPIPVPVQPEPEHNSFDRAAFERSLREARL